jgi:hypothetical protein
LEDNKLEKRPFGITILSALVLIVSFIALAVGISALIPGTPLDALWNIKNSFPAGFQTTLNGKIFGSFILILGIIMLTSAYGLIKGNKIAWWIVLTVFTINLTADIISVIIGKGIDNISGIIIVGVLLVYMTRPSVKNYFSLNKNNP